MKKMITMLAIVLMIGVLSPSVAVMAATPTPAATIDMTLTDEQKQQLNNFQPLFILRVVFVLLCSVFTIIGGIQLVKSINEVTTALRQHDGAALTPALTGLGASAIQTFAPALLGFFGIIV